MLRSVFTKLKHRASPFRYSYMFSTFTPKPISALSNLTDKQSFTISYLKKSCGLSSESAISASKKLRIEPTHNPDSVLSLFRAHGLTQNHIRNIITKRPVLLLADLDGKLEPNLKLFKSLGFSNTSLAEMICKHPRVLESRAQTVFEFFRNHGFSEKDITTMTMKCPALFLLDPRKILKPKIDFFKSLGLSDLETAEILSKMPYILSSSLKNIIIRNVEVLRRFLSSNESVLKAIKGCHRVLRFNLEKVMEPNMSTLKSHGVPESLIVKLLMVHPGTMLLRGNRVSEIIGEVKNLGFDPNKMLFVLAYRTMAVMSKTLWEQKLETYRSFGMSKDDIYSAIKLQPMCMLTSVKKIQKSMTFFIHKLNMKPSTISRNPNLLMFSLEKRIIPRCSVLQLLLWRGLIDEDINFVYVLIMTEKTFMKRIMSKYKEVVPDVVMAHEGKIEFQGFPAPLNM